MRTIRIKGFKGNSGKSYRLYSKNIFGEYSFIAIGDDYIGDKRQVISEKEMTEQDSKKLRIGDAYILVNSEIYSD